MPLSASSRYRLPGQDLYAPVLDRGDFDGLDDSSAPGFDSDNQIQTAALPGPDPIPTPDPLRGTGPSKDLASAPPPDPSASPSAYSQLKDVPPASDQTGFTNKDALAATGHGGNAPPPPPAATPQPATPSAPPPPPPQDATIPPAPDRAGPPPPPVGLSDQLEGTGMPAAAPAPAGPTAMDRLKGLKAPSPPGQKYDDSGNLVPDDSQKPGWARRLLAGVVEGAGVLGELRGTLKPGTAQAEAQSILYPGYRKARAAYETQRSDIENQLNEELKEKQIEAQEEQRTATAEWRKAQALNISQAEADRAQANRDRIAQQTREGNRKFLADQLKGRESDAVYQQQTDNRPAGWNFIPDPERPGAGFAVPPAWMPVPAGLKVAGFQVGEMAPHTTIVAAQKAAEAAAAKTPNPTEADLALRAAQGDKDAEAALKRLDQSRREGRPVTNNTITIPGLGGAPNPQNAKLSGDEYLATLPQATANQVKGIAMGQSKIPAAGSRSADAQAIRQAVFQYDPTFTEQRAQVRQAFTAGADGRNIGALNTATVHLDQFAQVADAMGNGSFQPGNQLWNSVKAMFGDSAPTNFAGLKAAVSGELASALKGSATDQEIAHISGAIDSKNSPQQLRDYITEQLHVLGAKLNTYHERYQQQIPGDSVWNPVLPSARQVFQKHGIDPTAPLGGQGGAALPRVTTREQFDALPPGTLYTEDDGNTYKKPKP